jgi:hypothetical protein
MGLGVVEAQEVTQESLPGDLDQTPDFDPAEPEPAPDDDFDQTRGWQLPPQPARAEGAPYPRRRRACRLGKTRRTPSLGARPPLSYLLFLQP